MKLKPEAKDSRKEHKEDKIEHGYAFLFAIFRGQAANLTMLPKRFGWQ